MPQTTSAALVVLPTDCTRACSVRDRCRQCLSWSDDATVAAYQPSMRLPGRVRPRLRREWITRAFARYRASRPADFEKFSDSRTQFGDRPLAQLPTCDIVNLHWIADFMDYDTSFRQVPERIPVVWTLHDMNPFTEGCHWSHGCGRFTTSCGACPQLGSQDANDLSHHIWAQKRAIFDAVPLSRLHIVTPSRWPAGEVQRSPLLGRFPITVIANSLDAKVFAPVGRAAARESLGILPEAQVILFAAHGVTNRYKGFALLLEALMDLREVRDPFLVSLERGEAAVSGHVPHKRLGFVEDDATLARIYSAIDAFVTPSLQDNLPNTVMAAMPCGRTTRRNHGE